MHHNKSLELWQLPDDFCPELSKGARQLYGRLLHLTAGGNNTCLYPNNQGAKEFSVLPATINNTVKEIRNAGLIQTVISHKLRIVTVVKELAPSAPQPPQELVLWCLPDNFYPRLTSGSRSLYARLLHLTAGGTRSCFYTSKQGAKEFSCCTWTITQYFCELRKHGLVKTDMVIKEGANYATRLVTVVRERMPANPHRQDTL